MIELLPAMSMDLFDTHQAEEEPWLPAVFEYPPEFDLISGSRSCIVFGDSGSGKSALYSTLVNNSYDSDGEPRRLLVEWCPILPAKGEEATSDLVDRQLVQVFDACAFSVVSLLVRYPEKFSLAPEWAQWFFTWFIRQHLLGDFEARTGQLVQSAPSEGKQLIEVLARNPVRQVFDTNATPEMILAQLIKTLPEIGLNGVWVLVDKLEGWNAVDESRTSTGLTAFLSALGIFEQRNFAYKIFLPASLTLKLSDVSAVERRRVDVHHLRWTPTKLSNLLLKRISQAVGKPMTSLSQLCSDDTLLTWLQNCGGLTPRGWLEFIRPLVSAYLDRLRDGKSEPIDREEWLEIRRRHPPLFRLNIEQKQVFVGDRLVKDLTEGQFRLLAYLYSHAGQICTRSQLHYLADLELKSEPRMPSDEYYEAPANYAGKLDTAVWRLRELIEPDQADRPLYILTAKGKGYRLDNVR